MLNNKDIVPGTILKYSGQETKILILEEPVKSEVTNGYRANVLWITKNYWRVIEKFNILLDGRWIKLC